MRKIIFYINTIHNGGAERVITNLATQFSEKGYESILVTSFRDTWEYPCGNKVKRISLFESQQNENTIKNIIKRNLQITRRLRKVVNNEKPDVLLSFMAEPNFRALLACMGTKVKNIVSVRNDPDREYPNTMFRLCAKVLYPLADGVVFQTGDAKLWFSQKIQKKSRIIMNQVDEVFYKTNYQGKRKNIVTTGRLVAQKNHMLLIEAFADIADEVDDNLIIYGDGELQDKLQQRINELGLNNRVLLAGAVKDVAEKIKSAKLFVLSSDYEGMPNSLMEAMALGIPCISTDCPCGGPRVMLYDIGEGLLIETNNKNEMALKMKAILEDDTIAERISEKIKYRSEDFMPNKILSEWEKYMSEVS